MHVWNLWGSVPPTRLRTTDLDVVLKELESTNTYQEVHSDCSNVVSRHLKYMVQNNIFVQEQEEHLPSLTLGAHAQRGLQYLVCHSVCLSVCPPRYSGSTRK